MTFPHAPNTNDDDDEERVYVDDDEDDDKDGDEDEGTDDETPEILLFLKIPQFLKRELGLERYVGVRRVCNPATKSGSWFFSFVNNHAIPTGGNIDLDDLAKLKKRFGYTSPPMWYLDESDWFWTPANKRTLCLHLFLSALIIMNF